MGKNNSQYPNNFAEGVIQAASIKDLNQVFYVNAFSSYDISITAQRRRALNLGWALCKKNIVKHGSIIAVVGAGFSGLAIAVELALLKRCVVILIEKEKPFKHFNQSAFRYIDKKFNTSSSPGGEPGYIDDSFPLFRWKADNAHIIIQKWLAEFKQYQRSLPILLSENLLCDSLENIQDKDVLLKLRPYYNYQTFEEPHFLKVQTCILATGFGLEERSIRNVEDCSYWKSGSPYHYYSYKSKEKILISGAGDSGLIEVLHYLLRDFSHSDIDRFVKPFEGWYLDHKLSHTYYYNITKEFLSPRKRIEEIPSIKTPILQWYWSVKKIVDPSCPLDKLGYPKIVKRIYLKIDELVEKYIGKIFTYELVDGYINSSSYELVSDETLEKYEKKLCDLSQKRVSIIIRSIAEDLKELKAEEILNIFEDSHLKHDAQLLTREFVNKNNKNYQIYWIVDEKGPISGRISPIYLPIVVALIKSKTVVLIHKRISQVNRTSNQMNVKFEDSSVEMFDRVATRHGPSKDTIANHIKPKFQEKTIECNEISGTFGGYYEERFSGKYFNYRGYVDPVTDDLNKAISKIKQKEKIFPALDTEFDYIVDTLGDAFPGTYVNLEEMADNVLKTKNWCWRGYIVSLSSKWEDKKV